MESRHTARPGSGRPSLPALSRLLPREVARVVLPYVILSAVWIYFSDAVVNRLTRDTASATFWSTVKGWAFVAVTAALLAATLSELVRRLYGAQSALTESNERYRLIAENSADVIFQLDPASGRFTYASPSVKRLLGYDAEEILDRSLNEVLTPDSAALVARRLPGRVVSLEAGNEADRVRVLELDQYRRDHSVVPTEVVTTLLTDAAGRVTSLLGVARDITERRRSLRALEESEFQYRRLFEDATEGVALADAATGVLLDCNRAFIRLIGYERSEIIGQPQRMLHPPGDLTPDGLTESFASRRTEAGLEAPAAILTKSGEIRQVEVKANRIEIGGRHVIQGFFRDVTDVRRHHHERETTLQLLRLLNDHDNTHALIRSLTEFLHDWTDCEAVGVRLAEGHDFPYFETRGFPAAFVRVESVLCLPDATGDAALDAAGNPMLACMCGNVIQGRFDPSKPFFTRRGSFWTNSTTDLLASTTDADRQARTRNRCNGEGYESVALVALRHGTTTIGLLQFNDRRRGRFTPDLIAFLESLADQIAIALAQRRAQANLVDSEARARSQARLLDLAHDAIMVRDLAGRVHYWNRSAEDLYGWTADEAIGRLASELYWTDSAQVAHAYRQLRETGGWAGELNQRTKAGRELSVSSRWTLVRGIPGQPDSVLVINTDVTERKVLETQVLRVQRLDALGQLAGGVAHDFNNILAAMMLQLQLLRGTPGLDAATAAGLADMEAEAQRAASLTRQLLLFSRRQIMQTRRLDLNEIVLGLMKMLGRLIGEHIDLIVEPCREPAWIDADAGMIEQVVMNLCVNARDAMQAGGRIVVSVACEEIGAADARLDPEAQAGRVVRLSVSDTGHGIDEATRARLFEPFFTTKDVGKGTGLGLATVRSVARQHHGWVQVRSLVGRGSTFSVYLPVAAAAAEDRAAADGRASGGGTETILLVEDNDSLRRSMAMHLSSLGYDVLVARHGVEAQDMATRHPSPIHLLLTDMVMPQGITGLALARQLQGERPDLRVVVISGYSADLGHDAAGLPPGARFLAKPFHPAALTAAVRECLDQSRAARR
jgi:PAS domain S-box-containing protein